MSYFKQGSTTTECLLELISNQLQLTQQQDQMRSAGELSVRRADAAKCASLRTKIVNQRNELDIIVDGV